MAKKNTYQQKARPWRRPKYIGCKAGESVGGEVSKTVGGALSNQPVTASILIMPARRATTVLASIITAIAVTIILYASAMAAMVMPIPTAATGAIIEKSTTAIAVKYLVEKPTDMPKPNQQKINEKKLTSQKSNGNQPQPDPNQPIKITIDRGTIKTINLGLSPIVTNKAPADSDLAQKIFATINNNLRNAGLFDISTIATPNQGTIPQRLADLKKNGYQFILTAEIIHDTNKTASALNNNLILTAHLWDLSRGGGKETIGKDILGEHGITLKTTRDNWHRLASQLSDDIYTRLSGEKGYFDSRIAFIAEDGSKKKRIKRLAIMNQDGSGLQYLSSGRNLVLTPRFSNSQHMLSYISYATGAPQVVIFDLMTGITKNIGRYDGMSFAPRFSPDDKQLIFSIENNGATNIYIKPLNGSNTALPLTNDSNINTSPSFAPDGQHIAFTSDRDGSPQVYIMNKDGSGIKRISYGAGSYSTPVWSPRGDYIAFTKQYNNIFYIGIVKPDGSDERLLSDSFLDEGPTWSPNGRGIAFFRQPTADDDTLSLWTVDITGRFIRKIPVGVSGSDPSWSPLNSR
ncbi:MAG: Tol-Pal system protein TolB [Alphaproteobacteria bacterium]|nr:Tol-Pal system protein TolB [Alphaproteobacteria bacterium]